MLFARIAAFGEGGELVAAVRQSQTAKPRPEGGVELRLPAVTAALTVAASLLILVTLPVTVPPSVALWLGVGVVAGAAATLGTYFGLPNVAWLPCLPAAVTVAVLMAVTGGTASPYHSLLLVLLVGGATLARTWDVLIVALLVMAAAVTPLIYEPWTEYGLIANALEAASWALAAIIVAQVSANLRAARHRVEQRTRLVAAVLGSLPQQAAVVDESGRILLTNQAWDRVHALSGAAPDNVAAGADYAAACQSREGTTGATAADLVDDLQQVLAGSRTSAVSELSWELLVGEHHWYTVRTTALPSRLGAVVTHEDLTPLLEAERARQLSLERLRELDDRKTALLRAVSHDVRTPLTVISGVADTLQRNLPSLDRADIQQLVDGLTYQSRRLVRLLSGLLVLSPSEDDRPSAAGSGHLHPQPTNVRDAILAALEHVDTHGRQFISKRPDGDLVVRVDPWILDCVLERLLDNAVRHTPSGTTIEIDAQLAHGRMLAVRVTDDGPGVPEEDQERIFVPFEQGTHAHPHDPGAGIGLTVVRQAARLHGGDVWIEAAGRSGASFRLELEVDAD